jgi:hydrogenase/urease accessory protein HupE
MFTIFLELGFDHILDGYDHLLFLAGLIIVATDWRALLAVISAFTVTHSMTLVLSALDILALDPEITETLIAASIAYVGIENLVMKEQRRRWIVAGAFGLIHGAGFSGHLTELLRSMMDLGNIWGPLIGFNVGIELGQVVVIAISIPIIYGFKKLGKWEALVPELSRVIAAVGVFLVVSRVWEV